MADNEDQDLRRLLRLPAYRREGREGDRLRAEVLAGFAARYPGPVRYDATGRMDTNVVAVRSYPRREPDGGVHTVRAHDRAARPAQAPAQRPAAPARPAAPQPSIAPRQPVERAWEEQTNRTWRERIAAEESDNGRADHGYGRRSDNPNSTAKGRYQINNVTLVEAGWRMAGGQWTTRAAAHGVVSDATFLALPRAQEAALSDVLAGYEREIGQRRLWRFAGMDLPGLNGQPVRITEAGLVAAAHRQGAQGLADYLAHRLAGMAPPASVQGRRGPLSKLNAIEGRLRAFSGVSYQRITQ